MEDTAYSVHLTRCPYCRGSLYLPEIQNFRDVICPKCTTEYSFQEYQFLAQSTKKVEDTYHYRLRIRSSLGTEAISFQYNKSDLSFFKDDRLLILCKDNKIALLKNLTEGWGVFFRDSWLKDLLENGAIAVLLGLAAMMSFGGRPMAFIVAPISACLLYWRKYRLAKRRRLEMAQALQDSRIIQERLSFVYRDRENLLKINEELLDIGLCLDRLQEIRAGQVSEGLSRSEADTLDRAIACLSESLDVMVSLSNNYNSKLQRTWLDIEVRSLAVRMPDSLIEYKLKSQDLEQQLQEELDAIAEVKALFANEVSV